MSKRRIRKASMRIARKVLTSPPVKNFVAYTKRTALPGFDGMPIYYVADFFLTGIQRGRIVTRAQALAFSFFLAIFPAIIFIFSLIPYIPLSNFQEQLLQIIQDIMPDKSFSAARATIEDIIKIPRGGLLSFGFLTALYFTTNGFMTLMRGFNSSYHIAEKRSRFKQRIVALNLTVILSLLVVASTALLIFSKAVANYLVAESILKTKTQFLLIQFGKWAVLLGLILSWISFLFYYAPATKKRWRFISAGSIFATILTVIISTGFAYFVNHFGSYNKIYGSIGTLIVIMLLIYFNSFSLILGFELNASIENAKRKLSSE